MTLSCDCDTDLFKIKFSPEGLAVICAGCGTVVGMLVDTKKGAIQ